MSYQPTELEELEGIYSETHKDVYGVKARWYHAESVEQAREDLARLQVEAEVVWAQAQRAQLEALGLPYKYFTTVLTNPIN